MIDSVQNNKKVGPVAATFADGYRVAEIVDTALQSSETGRFEEVQFRD